MFKIICDFSMILFFLSLRFILRNGHAIETKDCIKYKNKDKSWFYINCKENQNCSEMFSFLFNDSFHLTPISRDLFTAYLSSKEVSIINKSSLFQILEIPQNHKDLTPQTILNKMLNTSEKTLNFAVKMSSNCSIPYNKLSQLSATTFLFSYQIGETSLKKKKQIYQKIHKTLSLTKCVRAFELISKPTLHTRYTRSVSFNETDDLMSDPYFPYNSRSIYLDKGLNGAGQCATIADNGLYTDSCWFKDYGASVPYGTFLSDHRKIVSYMKYTDDAQSTTSQNSTNLLKHKHGTFVAGIVAGNALCKSSHKKYCTGSFYDGVAPGARLFIQEVMNEDNGKLEFQDNISELFELPKILNCNVILNAWSYERSQLITHAVDHLAFSYPEILFVFPAGDNETEGYRSPADGKNVLTVGAYYHDSMIENEMDEAPAVKITIDDTVTLIGFCDRFAGVSFLDALTRSHLDNFNKGMYIGVDPGQIFLDDNGDRTLDEFTDAGLVIAFHSKPFIGRRLNTSVIRLAPKHRPRFKMGAKIVITPYCEYKKSIIKPNTIMNMAHGPVKFERIKPDIILPGGPVLAPKAGETQCNADALSIGEGTSVAAAIAVGDVLILKQWLFQGYYPTGKKTPMKSVTPHSHLLRAILAHCSQLPRGITRKEGGFGLPHLDRFMILPELYNASKELYGII